MKNSIGDLDEIYKENYKLVYKYLLSITHNEDISEELAEETFYKATINISKFKNNSKLSTWLCKIARNLWIDEIKRRNKIGEIDDKDIIVTEDVFLEKEERMQLFKSIQKLDVLTRDVIYLKIRGDLSYKEIAEIMNTTETWVRVTFYRGKEKIKEENNNEKQRL